MKIDRHEALSMNGTFNIPTNKKFFIVCLHIWFEIFFPEMEIFYSVNTLIRNYAKNSIYYQSNLSNVKWMKRKKLLKMCEIHFQYFGIEFLHNMRWEKEKKKFQPKKYARGLHWISCIYLYRIVSRVPFHNVRKSGWGQLHCTNT